MEFDRVVRTEPLLRLRYKGEDKADRRVSDAQEIAKVLRVGAVVLASVPSTDMMELQIVSGTERRTGRVRIPTTPSGPTAGVASAAAAALANGECTDFTGPKPVAIDCKTARAEATKATKATKKKGHPVGLARRSATAGPVDLGPHARFSRWREPRGGLRAAHCQARRRGYLG